MTRLKRLEELLRADAANPNGVQFDLEGWIKTDNRGWFYQGGPLVEEKKIPVSCETTACAVGLACLSKEFQDEGLGYRVASADEDGRGILIPTYGSATAYDAVCKFFDLEPEICSRIFASGYYPEDKKYGSAGEIAVADRIKTYREVGEAVFLRMNLTFV